METSGPVQIFLKYEEKARLRSVIVVDNIRGRCWPLKSRTPAKN